MKGIQFVGEDQLRRELVSLGVMEEI